MSSSRKLRTAHFLMFIGVTPLIFAGIVSLVGIAFARAHPGTAGGSDAFLMLALLTLGFSTTVVLGGTGALWSWFLTYKHIDAATTATRVLQITVVAGIIVVSLMYLIALSVIF